MNVLVAEVITEDSRITKAKAVLAEDHLTVTDRRGRVLFEVEAPRESVSSTQWRYGSVTVTKMNTCGCGGTKVTPR